MLESGEMKHRWIWLLQLCLVIGLVLILDRRWSVLPPLGLVFSPGQGVWRGTWDDFHGVELPKTLRGLSGNVTVAADEQGIPHVFGNSSGDVFFMQGYITARDRLWQMDFQARIAQGRVSEILGPRTLPIDRMFVQLQLTEAVRRSLRLVQEDTASWEALTAYSEGVNAFIRGLSPQRLPIEYKILDARPELWTPEKSLLTARLMAFRLAGISDDVPRTRSALKLGKHKYSELFGLLPEVILPTYQVREMNEVSPHIRDMFWPAAEALSFPETPKSAESSPGSNAWALSGRVTKNRHAILASDPHLSYTLPSVWYPIQLHASDVDAIGLSLVGAPGIVIGSSGKVAWGVTNGYPDVLDFYRVRFRDALQQEYLAFDRWEASYQRSHQILVRGSAPEEMIVKWTRWGPVIGNLGKLPGFLKEGWVEGLVMRWMGHEASNEVATFLQLNRAQSLVDCPQALRQFVVPSQNFVCADVQGRVGAWLSGKIPKKEMGQGRFVLDASRTAHHWQGFIERGSMPSATDQDFVFTANQRSVSSRYKFELGNEFLVPYRAQSIKSELSRRNDWTPGAVGQLQNSEKDLFLCEFKSWVQGHRASLEPEAQDFFSRHLQRWDCNMSRDSVAASVWMRWWLTLYQELWTDVIGESPTFAWPDRMRTLGLLRKGGAIEGVPVLPLLSKSFRSALTQMQKEHGSQRENWRWGKVQGARLEHVSRLPGFGRSLESGGSGDTIMANQHGEGPSMRLVVEMAQRPRVWLTVPGGRQGDRSHAHYEDWVRTWSAGELHPVPFFESREQARARSSRVQEVQP